MTTMTTEPGAKTARARRHLSSKGIRPTSRHGALTLGGVIYIVVTLFLAVGAVNAQNNLLFWLFGVAIALLIVSGTLSGNALMRLQITPQTIPDGRAGQSHTIRYQLTSTSRLSPIFGAIIRERIDAPNQLEQLTPGVIIHLAPGQHTSCTAQIQPQSRGRCTLESFQIECSFPLGVIRKWIRFDHPRSFIALPHRLDLQSTAIGNTAATWSDDPRSQPTSGDSTDYFGLRQYIPGDTRRKIAWKQSARRNGLVVIEHAQETSPQMMIWLRKPLGSDDPVLIERAIAMVCAVARQAIESKRAVGVWIPWASIRLTPDAGNAQLYRIEHALALLNLDSSHRCNDSDPPLQMGQLVQISCTHQSGTQDTRHLYADRPDMWLAHGAQLPQALICEGTES